MLTVELVVLAVVAVAMGLLVVVSRCGRRDDASDPGIEFATWRRVDAEVISTLRAGNRAFLRVRFSVGTSLIQNDVQYPLPGAAPHAGQRVPIRYDPAAPARMMFDLYPTSRTPLRVRQRVTQEG
jgi:hypothetical protein